MGNNFSVSYTNEDIKLFNYLKEKLPRQYSLSEFCMVWIKKGIKDMRLPGATLDPFQTRNTTALPGINADNIKWREVVKNIPNDGLKDIVNHMNQKINIVSRELQKRI